MFHWNGPLQLDAARRSADKLENIEKRPHGFHHHFPICGSLRKRRGLRQFSLYILA
jgi:hypothetical protein